MAAILGEGLPQSQSNHIICRILLFAGNGRSIAVTFQQSHLSARHSDPRRSTLSGLLRPLATVWKQTTFHLGGSRWLRKRVGNGYMGRGGGNVGRGKEERWKNGENTNKFQIFPANWIISTHGYIQNAGGSWRNGRDCHIYWSLAPLKTQTAFYPCHSWWLQELLLANCMCTSSTPFTVGYLAFSVQNNIHWHSLFIPSEWYSVTVSPSSVPPRSPPYTAAPRRRPTMCCRSSSKPAWYWVPTQDVCIAPRTARLWCSTSRILICQSRTNGAPVS